MINEDPLERTEEERLNSFKENLCTKPEPGSNFIMIIWWAIQYPAVVILALTTPSPRAPYFLTIIVSIIWIGVLSYLSAWFLTVLGYNLGVPDAIMGLTVLAVGTSIPEVVSSYIVCRKGSFHMIYSEFCCLEQLSHVICCPLYGNHFINPLRYGLNGHVQCHRCEYF